MDDPLIALTEIIAKGLAGAQVKVKPLLDALFGGRYYSDDRDNAQVRDRLDLPKAPFAGFTHPDTHSAGQYGGASLIWFPAADHGSIITFVVGTGGLIPDQGLLSRPGHRRRIIALRQLMADRKVLAWSKHDPTAILTDLPQTVRDWFPGFDATFQEYGKVLYAIAQVPKDPTEARRVVQVFFDLYAYERRWRVLKAGEGVR